MFEIHTDKSLNTPMLACDICAEPLNDMGAAAAVFSNSAPDGSRLKVFFVHKGHIEGKTCHDQADARIRAEGGAPGWQEGRRFLTDLAEYDKRPSL